jgi:hypothetical protein
MPEYIQTSTSEYIEINILKEECFVCFETSESEYTTLKCCNRNNIHKKCLFNIFLNYLTIQSSIVSCPLCRQEINIKDYFTLDEAITFFSNNDNMYKIKFLNKFNTIVTHNFIDSEHILQIDEETSTVSIVEKKTFKRYIYTIVVFIILVIIVIGLKSIPL